MRGFRRGRRCIATGMKKYLPSGGPTTTKGSGPRDGWLI